jgi:signal peptidase
LLRRVTEVPTWKKGLKATGNILFIVFIVLMVCLVGFMVKGKLDGGVPKLGPYALYIVLSGSMNPQFDTGSLIAVENTAPQDIQVGNIITFKNPEDQKMLITHRVLAVNNVNGKLNFLTKGDANNAPDTALVPAENLIGQAVYWVPYAGYATEFAKSKKGLLIMIIIPGVLILGGEILKLYRYAVEYDEEEKRKKLMGRQEKPAGIRS